MDDKVLPDQKDMNDAVQEAALTTTAPKDLSTIDEQYLEDNARVGLEELTPDDLPTPTLQMVNASSSISKVDGTPVRQGYFYYGANDIDAEKVTVSFLSYTKEMLPSFADKNVMEKTYVFMGALDTEDGFKPFKMYLRRTNIGVVKRFLGQVVASRKPMYALQLELSTEKRISDQGKPYYVLVITNNGVRKYAADIPVLEDLARQYGAKLREEKTTDATDQQGKTINGVEVAGDISF